MKKLKTFEHLLERVKHNDPRYVLLDLREFHLTKAQFDQLASAMENNSVVSSILWGKADDSFDRSRVGKKAFANLNKENYAPVSGLVNALLSKHVHVHQPQTVNDKILTDLTVGSPVFVELSRSQGTIELVGWRVKKIFNNDPYFGVAYVNEAKHHVVLVHGGHFGLPNKLSDLIAKNHAAREALDGVLGGNIVTQQAYAYDAITDIISRIDKQESDSTSSTLSTTGFGMGAWLAALSVYFYKAAHPQYSNPIPIVTFDGPGSFDAMKNDNDNAVVNPYRDIYKKLDIVSYLSPPNLINSCNKHMGKVYLLNITFPELSETWDTTLSLGGHIML